MLYSTPSFDDKLLPLIEKDAAFKTEAAKLRAEKREKDAILKNPVAGILYYSAQALFWGCVGYLGTSALASLVPLAQTAVHIDAFRNLLNVIDASFQIAGPLAAVLGPAAYGALRLASRKDFTQQIAAFQNKQTARNKELIALQKQLTPTPTRSQILLLARQQAKVLSLQKDVAVIEKKTRRAKFWKRLGMVSYVLASIPCVYSSLIYPFLIEGGQTLIPATSFLSKALVVTAFAGVGTAIVFGRVVAALGHQATLAQKALQGFQQVKALTTAQIDQQNGPGQALVLASALLPRTPLPVSAASADPVASTVAAVPQAAAGATPQAPAAAHNPRASLWQRVRNLPAAVFKKH